MAFASFQGVHHPLSPQSIDLPGPLFSSSMISLRRSKSETSVSTLTFTGRLEPTDSLALHTSPLSSRAFLDSGNSELRDASYLKLLLSLPILQPVLDLVKKRSAISDGTDDLEDALLFVVAEAMSDPSSPWAKLAPKPPPVVGPRTPEQYLCALDIAIKARKLAKEKNKIAKFWKQEATKSAVVLRQDLPLTPSPSDISDTGLSEPLPPTRRDKVEELITTRRVVADVSGIGTDIDSTSKLGGPDIPSRSHFFDSGSVTCVSLSASPEPVVEEPDSNTILDSCKLGDVPYATRIPSLKRYQTALPRASLPLLHGSGSPMLSKTVTKSHTCCDKSRRTRSGSQSSRTALSSVQTKCRLYESLSSRPSSTPTRDAPQPQTSFPSAITKSHLETGNVKVRGSGSVKGSLSRPHPSSPYSSATKAPRVHQVRRGKTDSP